jgi:ribosomal-protein-alanine N-acetyltransferase
MRKFSGREEPAVGVERGTERSLARVRKFHRRDADALVAIVAESPEASIWSEESYVKLAEENATLALVSKRAKISGFLVGRMVGDQAEVLNLAVRARDRRTGGGGALLEAALKDFGLRGAKCVYLEVRESNTGAIAFYEKHGFAQVGRRKGYYRNPDEAAVTMETKLTG